MSDKLTQCLFLIIPTCNSVLLNHPNFRFKQDEAHEPECQHVCWRTETILIYTERYAVRPPFFHVFWNTVFFENIVNRDLSLILSVSVFVFFCLFLTSLSEIFSVNFSLAMLLYNYFKNIKILQSFFQVLFCSIPWCMSKCLGAAPVGSPCVPGQGPGTGLWRGSCRGSGEGGGDEKNKKSVFFFFFASPPPKVRPT